MNNIEELAQNLSSSPSFKILLKQQINECLTQLQQQQQSEQVRLQSLVQQVSSQMASITQFALQQQNSHRYMSLMKSNEEMCLQIQKRMEIEMKNRINSVNQQIEEIRKQMKKTFKDVKNVPSHHNYIKEQRKSIAKNILQTSTYFKNKGKTKSTIHPSCMLSKPTDSSLLNQSQNQSQIKGFNASVNYQVERSYICSCQSDKENTSCNNRQISTVVDKLQRDNILVSQKFKQMSDSLQSKIDNNLQGVWNVLSDLTNRTSKLQTQISVIDLVDPKSSSF